MEVPLYGSVIWDCFYVDLCIMLDFGSGLLGTCYFPRREEKKREIYVRDPLVSREQAEIFTTVNCIYGPALLLRQFSGQI